MTNEAPEFAEEYTFRERVRLMARGVAIGGVVILAWKLWLLPGFRAFVATAPCRTLFGVNGGTVLWYGLFVGLPLLVFLVFALTEGRRGIRIVRGSRFPPAGEKVLRRTRVRRGAAARRIGCFYLFVSTPLLALAIWGGFQAHSLSPKMQPCPLVFGCPWPTSCKLPNMQLTLEIEREEDGRWLAEVPQLPGVLAYGATSAEAMLRAEVLALRALAERIEHGEAKPVPINFVLPVAA